MGSITVKLPDDMERDLEAYTEESGRYMSTSELVRDALRRHMEAHPVRLSEWAKQEIAISEEQIERGEVISGDEIKNKYGVE